MPPIVDLTVSPHQPGNPYSAYINTGDSVVVTWNTTWPRTGCNRINVSLVGTDYAGRVVFQRKDFYTADTMSLKPTEKPTYYTYTVACSDTNVSASKKVTVDLYIPTPAPASCNTYCFMVKFPQSGVCFTEARCAGSASEAETFERQQNPSASVTKISCDLSSMTNSCP